MASAVRALVAFLVLSGCCEFSGPRYHGRPTDHFDGRKFHNQIPGAAPTPAQVMRWRMRRRAGRWPRFDPITPRKPPPDDAGELRVTLVNHSTVLLHVGGINILTDPIWGEIAGPTPYLGRTRHRPPGIRLEDLPPIDLVLLSHDHYDHLDIGTLQRIVRAHHPRILAGLGIAALLRTYDIGGVTDLDWWQWTGPYPGLRVYGVPARHGCRRGACDDDARLWLGFVLRTRQGDIYFAGDTGYGPHFQQIAERFGPFLLALLPIAPGAPRALFAPVHLDARDAVIAARILDADVNIPIHFGTFAQGDEADGEPEARLRGALQEPDSPRFVVLHNGESFPTSSPGAGGS